MATISSIGIGSGIDVNSVITQLIAVERVPLTTLQTESTSLQTRLSTYGKMKSAMSALRDAAAALAKADTWGQTTGSSSDASAVGVTTTTSTRAGQYTIEVQKLASGQSNVTGTYASADALVGEGSLHIQLGTWNSNQTAFTAAGAAVDVSVGPPAESLAQLRDKINASNAGVTASVLTDASGARLVLRSTATGAANGFKLSVNDSDGNNIDGVGLSALAFDPSAGILTMAQALAAANATATLNGLPISSASNTLTNVVDGLTIALNKVTTAPVQLSAAQDTPGIRKAMDSFVSAYNDLNKLITDQTKYDPSNKKRDNLQGDSAALSIRTLMRNTLGTNSTASSVFTRVADVGLDVQTDGSIKVNEAKLSSAMANLAEVKKLFSNADLVTPANNGLGLLMRNMGDQILSTDGTLKTRQDGLQKRIDLNRTRQEKMTDRIADVEKRLRAQYTALDRQMASLNGLSGLVTQQLNAYNNSNYR